MNSQLGVEELWLNSVKCRAEVNKQDPGIGVDAG